MKSCKWIALGVAILFFATTADALIQALTPMKKIMADSHFVVEAAVVDVLPLQPGVVLEFKENLKGEFKIKKMPINMEGDGECKKLNHTPQLMKRLSKDLPVILFLNYNKANDNYIGFAYTNGTWFQVQHDASKGGAVWSLTHGEPYLRRTFKGTTQEMKTIVVDNVKKGKRPPPEDPKEAPGFGPEVGGK